MRSSSAISIVSESIRVIVKIESPSSNGTQNQSNWKVPAQSSKLSSPGHGAASNWESGSGSVGPGVGVKVAPVTRISGEPDWKLQTALYSPSRVVEEMATSPTTFHVQAFALSPGASDATRTCSGCATSTVSSTS